VSDADISPTPESTDNDADDDEDTDLDTEDELIDEQGRESFPASDPPAH